MTAMTQNDEDDVRIEEVDPSGRKTVFASKDPAKAVRAAALYREALADAEARRAAAAPPGAVVPPTPAHAPLGGNGSQSAGEQRVVGLLRKEQPFTLPQAIIAYRGRRVTVRDPEYADVREEVLGIINSYARQHGFKLNVAAVEGKRDKFYTFIPWARPQEVT